MAIEERFFTSAATPPISRNEDDTIQNVLICSLCCEIPLDPVITPVCEHIFCRLCISQALEIRLECPNDRRSLQRGELPSPGGALWRMWEGIQLRCPNKKCTWYGNLGSYELHAARCISDKENSEHRIQELKKECEQKLQHLEDKCYMYELKYFEQLEAIQSLQAENQKLKLSNAPVGVKHSNSKRFDVSCRYDRFRLAELSPLICRDLNEKPNCIDAGKIFNLIKISFEQFKNSYHDNPASMCEELKMLIQICLASLWSTALERYGTSLLISSTVTATFKLPVVLNSMVPSLLGTRKSASRLQKAPGAGLEHATVTCIRG